MSYGYQQISHLMIETMTAWQLPNGRKN